MTDPKATVRWRDFYELKAKDQKFLPAYDEAEIHRVRMVKRLINNRPVNALDVGCGDGYLCHVLSHELGVTNVVGLDIAESHVRRAREQFPGLTFLEGSIYDLPFPDNAFDLVLAVEVLEHLEDPAAGLSEMARVSARRVIVTVPHNEVPQKRLCPHCLKEFFLDGHIQRFDKHSLVALARAQGLEPEKAAVYRPWEERRLVRKLYSPLKRLIFPEDYQTGGWLALSADKPVNGAVPVG